MKLSKDTNRTFTIGKAGTSRIFPGMPFSEAMEKTSFLIRRLATCRQRKLIQIAPSFLQACVSPTSKVVCDARKNNYYFDIMNQHSYSRASDLYDYAEVDRTLMRKYMNTEKPIWFTETGFVDVGGGHGLYKGMLGEPKPALTAYRDILTKELSDVELVEQLHGNRGTGFLEGRGAPRLPSACRLRLHPRCSLTGTIIAREFSRKPAVMRYIFQEQQTKRGGRP